MRPITMLADDAVELQQGRRATHLEFWRNLTASILEGFFDRKRLIIPIDKERQMSSAWFRDVSETHGWAHDSDEAQNFIKQCWGSISTLTQWANAMGYDIRPEWELSAARPDIAEDPAEQEASSVTERNDQDKNKENQTPIGAIRRKEMIIETMRCNPRLPKEMLGSYDERISERVNEKGEKASTRLVRKIREERARLGKIGI